MNDKDVIDIAQDLGVVAIAVSANFGLDLHVQVSWARGLSCVSHTVRQVLEESRYNTLQDIEIMNNDEFITIIRTQLFPRTV